MTQTVWQALADACNLDEKTARRVCDDFHDPDSGVDFPAEGDADNYQEFLIGLLDWMETPDIRQVILSGEEEISYQDQTDDMDYFSYASKVNPEDVNKYIVNSDASCCNCPICADTLVNPVTISCGGRSCIFCKKCITPWITEYCARCPTCRKFLNPVSSQIFPGRQKEKQKIVITIKKKQMDTKSH